MDKAAKVKSVLLRLTTSLIQRCMLSFQVLLATIGDGTNTKVQGKIVVLAHDQQFAQSFGGISVSAVFHRFIKVTFVH